MKLERIDCSRGAPMGRVNRDLNNAGPVKMHLQHVPLDSGGYDEGGAYWGLRPPESFVVTTTPIGETVPQERHYYSTKKIYWYWWNGNKPSAAKPVLLEGFIDAWDREDAKAQIRKHYPEATFYR